MRSRTPFFVLLLLASSFSFPLFAHAGSIPFLGPIIPPESVTGVPGSEVCAAGWGLLVIVINNLIRFFLTLAIVFVAPLMIAYAGFLFVVNPVNSGGIQKAKDVLTHTVVGIVIALSGWMIVGAVMAVLYHPSDSTWGTWTSLISGGEDCIPLASSLSPAAPPAAQPISVVPGGGTEQSIRDRLALANVSVNKAACSTGQMAGPACGTSPGPSCTNVANMQGATIQQLINIAGALGKPCDALRNPDSCAVIVTGGTEPGHACSSTGTGHADGYKVDLRPSTALDAYLKNPAYFVGTRTGDHPGPAWTDSCGVGKPIDQQNQYVREEATATQPAHWDITIRAACGTSSATAGPTAPSPGAGSTVSTFSTVLSTSSGTLKPTAALGQVAALKFNFPTGSSGMGITLVETTDSPAGDTAQFTVWVSSTPNGPALGGDSTIQNWQYTGGTVRVVPLGTNTQFSSYVKASPGDYYFNVLYTSGKAGTANFFVKLN